MSKKTPYEISGSSLVNLKAELYRKQEESRRRAEKKPGLGTAQQGYVAVRNNSLKSKIRSSKADKREVESNKPSDQLVVEPSEEEQRLEKSKASLVAKTKLYEKYTAQQYTPDEGEEEHLLVDFSRKIQDVRRFDQRKASRYSSDSDDDSDSEAIGPIPLPQNAEEEWAEYEDYLGRSRKCLQKDLPSLLNQNEKLRSEMTDRSSPGRSEWSSTAAPPVNGPSMNSGFDFGQSPLEERTLMSEDMHREMERRQWEQAQLDDPSESVEGHVTGGKVPIHYQSVENNEIRDLGVGYFKFSKEEDKRNEELENLKKLHEQTSRQRTQNQLVKAKRKAVMDARLAKVRERKLLKGELVAEPREDDDDEFEKSLAANAPPPTFVEDLTPAFKTGPPQARLWDKGKVDPDLQDKTYMANRREDRNLDFAPPSFYSESVAQPSYKKQKNRPSNNSREEFIDHSASFGYQNQQPQEPSFPAVSHYQSGEKAKNQKKKSASVDSVDSVDPSYQPWEHMQPWKNRAMDQEASTTAAHLQRADEKRPWAFAPPPTMYSEELKPMVFGRAGEEEIRKQARKLFSAAPSTSPR